jgi:hypothetical protein
MRGEDEAGAAARPSPACDSVPVPAAAGRARPTTGARIGQDAGGQVDPGRHAGHRRRRQLHLDAHLGGEPADHVVAQEPGRRGQEVALAAQPLVGPVQLVLVHPDALVADRDQVAVAEPPAVDLDLHVRRGEGQAVLDQLGEHVREAAGHRAGTMASSTRRSVTRRYSSTSDTAARMTSVSGSGSGPLPRAGGADEHQQALRVAAHAGGQVVELEQVRQPGRVGLLPLQPGDEAELAAQQVLVAAAEVGQRLRAGAAQLRLLGRQAVRRLLHPLERVGHLAHLVARAARHLHRSGGPSRRRRPPPGGPPPAALARQPVRLTGQRGQRPASDLDAGRRQVDRADQAEQTTAPAAPSVGWPVLQGLAAGLDDRADVLRERSMSSSTVASADHQDCGLTCSVSAVARAAAPPARRRGPRAAPVSSSFAMAVAAAGLANSSNSAGPVAGAATHGDELRGTRRRGSRRPRTPR